MPISIIKLAIRARFANRSTTINAPRRATATFHHASPNSTLGNGQTAPSIARRIVFSVCFVGIIGASAAIATAQQAPREVAYAQLRAVSPVSTDFRDRTVIAAESIPSGVWRRLDEGGWRVRMAAFVVDADPSLRGIQPRGWPDGTTWEHTDAVHLPAKRLLVFAEKRRNRDGDVVDSTRVENVLRHEVGHAFDRALGEDDYYSSTASFISVYFRDLARMSVQDRSELQYYLQRGPAGRQETFAEAFAILLGGGSASHRESSFVRAFPRVIEHVKEILKRHEGPRIARADLPRP